MTGPARWRVAKDTTSPLWPWQVINPAGGTVATWPTWTEATTDAAARYRPPIPFGFTAQPEQQSP